LKNPFRALIRTLTDVLKQSMMKLFCRLAVLALFPGFFLAAPVEGRIMSREETEISISGGTITICHNLGCKAQSTVTLSRKHLLDILRLFQPTAKTPRIERKQIRDAVALFEGIAGKQTSVHRDKGRNPNSIIPSSQPQNQVRTASLSLVPLRHYGNIEGQMDCVDESKNTTRFLAFLEQRGLLAWHRVLDTAFRTAGFFKPHWAAQIEEVASGERFAVDSWILDNGEPPYIQRLETWNGDLLLPVEGFE
jgi:hypothetical protein